MGSLCSHKPIGYVTNQDPRQPLDLGRPHASRVVCARPECQEQAKRWAAGLTNERAEFYLFGSLSKQQE